MKNIKGFWSRMVPVTAIVIATVIASLAVYKTIVEIETETCWDRLRNATESTAQKISVRITDNINFLDAVADSYVLTNHLELEAEVGEYLNSVMSRTIFEKIDVVHPDGYMLSQKGEKIYQKGEISYEELVKKGTHISPRITDPFINKEVIYFFTPIEKGGKVQAMLCGTINCDTLHQLFEVYTYKNSSSQMFMIDLKTGDYIIDNWHDKLGNLYDNQWRTGINGEKVDIATPIMNKETGRIAFISNTNGHNSYQYYTPVGDYNWGLCVVVQEDVVFANLHNLQKLLYAVAIVEAVLILSYLVWNIIVSASAAKSEEKARELELTRATNEAKARFISNMSHDVRTPLNGIVGMLHLIKAHRDDEKMVDDCLEKIEVSTHYLSTLASDILDINEIESDKLVLENQPINLNSLAEALTVMLEPRAKSSGVRYIMDCSNIKNPLVLGSTVHIERVMVNLISNAIKYSRQRGGEVCVCIEEVKTDEKQGVYRFTVKDNGIGMSEEFQKNMYNPFAQEKITARSSYQGYGLGLTIVYRLVEKMNGTIELQSKKDEGSTFTVTLPLELDKSEHAAPTELIITDLNGIRILLVEDNDINMEIAEAILSDTGAEVTTAINGRIAAEIFEQSEQHSFDLILMDIMMPEMDGIEATKLIRAMKRSDAKSIPIFAMTANTFAEEVNRCKEAGMNEHIAKPLNIEKLIQQVARYCKKTENVTERL